MANSKSATNLQRFEQKLRQSPIAYLLAGILVLMMIAIAVQWGRVQATSVPKPSESISASQSQRLINLATTDINQRNSDKTVIVLYKPGCPICDRLRHSVYETQANDQSLHPFTVLSVDGNSSAGRQLQLKYHLNHERMLLIRNRTVNQSYVYKSNLDSVKITNVLNQKLNLKLPTRDLFTTNVAVFAMK